MTAGRETVVSFTSLEKWANCAEPSRSGLPGIDNIHAAQQNFPWSPSGEYKEALEHAKGVATKQAEGPLFITSVSIVCYE